MRGLVQNRRVSGFAYEPSWLAGQLAALYLPWLFASLLSRYHLTKFRWLEPLLLLAALVGVLMTYSRSGLLVVAGAGLFTFILAGGKTLAGFWAWVRAGFDRQRWITPGATIQAAGSRIVLALLVVVMLAGAGAFLVDKGYIAAFFESESEDLFSYAVDVYLGPRLAYAVAALEAFQRSPWTGVGLGASGFVIYGHIPDWVLAGVPEISQQLSPDSRLYPNPKNLYVRLLAETGLAGFVLFIAFYLALLADASGILRASSPIARWLGVAALFTIAAVALQGFSQDSFAMPELWINLGMLAGAAQIVNWKSQTTENQ